MVKKQAFKKVTIILVGGIILLLAGYFYYINTEDQKARRTVDSFLNTIKTGGGDIHLYLDISKEDRTFINVLDYRFPTIKQKQDAVDKREYTKA